MIRRAENYSRCLHLALESVILWSMARTKPPLLRLHELKPGQYADFFALLVDKTKNTTRDGKPYFLCRFRDARRTATQMVWADSPTFKACESEWQPGHFYKLRGTYAEHERYGPQIDVELVRPVNDTDKDDGFDPLHYVESSRYDADAMLMELKQLAETHIADEPLRRLVLSLLETHAERFKRLPATRERFYPFAGGLLEHTLSVTRSCVQLVERYTQHYTELKPPLNRSLVVAGAILHDIGRVLEFGDEALAHNYTVPGRLVGHLILGRDLVREAALKQGDVPPELLQMLEHIILTHLALPEWGSPRLPLIPECLIVHHADDLDAKLEMYVRCLSRDQATGPFTDRDPALGRNLYKGRAV
jgi:3'-5' exoribonuclease